MKTVKLKYVHNDRINGYWWERSSESHSVITGVSGAGMQLQIGAGSALGKGMELLFSNADKFVDNTKHHAGQCNIDGGGQGCGKNPSRQ